MAYDSSAAGSSASNDSGREGVVVQNEREAAMMSKLVTDMRNLETRVSEGERQRSRSDSIGSGTGSIDGHPRKGILSNSNKQRVLRFSEEVSVSDLSEDETRPVGGSIRNSTYSIPLVDFNRGIGEEMQNDALTQSLRKRRRGRRRKKGAKGSRSRSRTPSRDSDDETVAQELTRDGIGDRTPTPHGSPIASPRRRGSKTGISI